jgi:hypothetical protein
VKGKLFAILAAMLCGSLASCNTPETMTDISQIVYTSDAGTILPELQWHEQIVIAQDKVCLTRNGRAENTKVNAGTWEIAVDEQEVAELFRQLEAVDRSAIQQIKPEDAPVGGDTESYTITYAGGKTFSWVYDPGPTYTSGELIVQPVQAFIQSLDLPADAASRYDFPAP